MKKLFLVIFFACASSIFLFSSGKEKAIVLEEFWEMSRNCVRAQQLLILEIKRIDALQARRKELQKELNRACERQKEIFIRICELEQPESLKGK